MYSEFMRECIINWMSSNKNNVEKWKGKHVWSPALFCFCLILNSNWVHRGDLHRNELKECELSQAAWSWACQSNTN
jgi:hypothetical protein